MIAYLDSSVLLRLVLREPEAVPLEELASREGIVSSELLAVECPRTIDRLRLQGSLSTEEGFVPIDVDKGLARSRGSRPAPASYPLACV